MNRNSLTTKDPFHHPDNAGLVIVVPQQRGDDQRKDDLNKFLRSKDVVKTAGSTFLSRIRTMWKPLLNVFSTILPSAPAHWTYLHRQSSWSAWRRNRDIFHSHAAYVHRPIQCSLGNRFEGGLAIRGCGRYRTRRVPPLRRSGPDLLSK